MRILQQLVDVSVGTCSDKGTAWSMGGLSTWLFTISSYLQLNMQMVCSQNWMKMSPQQVRTMSTNCLMVDFYRLRPAANLLRAYRDEIGADSELQNRWFKEKNLNLPEHITNQLCWQSWTRWILVSTSVQNSYWYSDMVNSFLCFNSTIWIQFIRVMILPSLFPSNVSN